MTLTTDLLEPTIPTPLVRQGKLIEDDSRAINKSRSQPEKFPPALFDQSEISVGQLYLLKIPVQEISYLSIGGGLGSFAWVDHLIIHGVKPSQIASIGFEEKPYGRYKRLCRNSQIPDEERLRSDSGSTPDNIWGWPGYAVREIFQDLAHLKLWHAAKLTWQIFTEPVFAPPFTPKAGHVYDSIEREAKRITWSKIWRFGRVRAIRKTDDGRFAVAYSQSTEKKRIHKIMITQHLHLAVGYSGFRFLPDLQAYREQTQDFKRVVNAYEDHNHVYQNLGKQGGTVLIRGRGIVASRIIQRLYEARQINPNINILHLMRDPKPTGSKYRWAQRKTENHFEQQAYNFPKACFGGDLRERLAKADGKERQALIGTWGGTTTAQRDDWESIIAQGLNEGWYQIRFGKVDQVHKAKGDKLLTIIQGRGMPQEETLLKTDYIIDATGLDADIENNPLLRDMLQTYKLAKNSLGRLSVSDHFEITGMRNLQGRVYACGAATLGAAYAPVDSFVGLQFAAQQSINGLLKYKAPGLKSLNIARSARQWLRWARGVHP